MKLKLVRCIVRAHKADETMDALKEGMDLPGFTVMDVSGTGRAENPLVSHLGRRSKLRYVPKTMIDVLVTDAEVDAVIEIVMNKAYTGRQGDGCIFVIPIDEAYSIRTRIGGPG